MTELHWEREAADAYAGLPAMGALLGNAVEDVLDQLEADSGSRLVRQAALRTPSGAALWRVSIRPRSDDWSLVWCEHPKLSDAFIIIYLGPATFSV